MACLTGELSLRSLPHWIFSIPSTTRFGAKTFPEGNLRDLLSTFPALLHLLFPSSPFLSPRPSQEGQELLCSSDPASLAGCPQVASVTFALLSSRSDSGAPLFDDLTFRARTASRSSDTPTQSNMSSTTQSQQGNLDRYVVIHVATTCDEHGVYVTKDSAEVIELGWILLDAKSCEEVGLALP